MPLPRPMPALIRSAAATGGLAAATAATLVLPASPAAALSLPSGCTPAGLGVTCTFLETAGPIVFDVPDGVTRATITAQGGSGGAGISDFAFVDGQTVTAGGLAGTATATFDLDPAVDLQITVGAAGQSGQDGGAGGSGEGAGGDGASFGVGPFALAGGGGGGGTAVRIAGTNAATQDPLLAAGGGGGAGGGFVADPTAGTGGGVAGGSASSGGAAGGTQAAGGAGGGPAPALAGEDGQRGDGGAALFLTAGGGGGGGYFGGGGAGLALGTDLTAIPQEDLRTRTVIDAPGFSPSLIGAGGGGGSGFGPANVAYGIAAEPGNGRVVITFALPDPGPTGGPKVSPNDPRPERGRGDVLPADRPLCGTEGGRGASANLTPGHPRGC